MVRLWLFGRVRFQLEEDGPVTSLKHERAQRLLAWLALEARDAPQLRSRIVRDLWAGSEAQRPDNSLAQALRDLRSGAGPAVDQLVREDGDRIGLAAGVWIDAVEFERMAGTGRDPEAALALADRPLLESVQRSGSGWDHHHRERLDQVRAGLAGSCAAPASVSPGAGPGPGPGPRSRNRRRHPLRQAAGLALAAGAAALAIVLVGGESDLPRRSDASACPPGRVAADPRDVRASMAARTPEGPRRTGKVAVGLRPASLEVGREGVWVAQREGVALIDPGTEQQAAPVIAVARQPAGPNAPFSLALARDRIWATRRDGFLVAIDRRSRRVAGPPIRYGEQAGDVALAGGAVWVNNYDDRYEGHLTRVDPCTGAVSRVRVGRQANTVHAAFGSLWVTSSVDAALFRLDARTGRRVARIDGLSDPQDMAAVDGELWVTQYGARSVQRIDPRVNRVVGEALRIGPDPAGITVGADAVWVPHYGNGTLTRIDLASKRPRTGVVAAGQSPTDAVVGFGRLWAPNNDGNTVTVMRP